jgi:hypothetical protein
MAKREGDHPLLDQHPWRKRGSSPGDKPAAWQI